MAARLEGTFRLVLNADRDPNVRRRVADLVRTDPETRFWDNLRRAPKLGASEVREKKAGSVPKDAVASRAQMRDEFPEKLRSLIIEELKKDYGPPSDTDATQASEAIKRIDGIRFTIKSIRGGSLEVLLVVLGFAKLVQATGITPEEFSKYMDIAAPAAMSLVFGVTPGAIVADTTQVGDAGSVTESGGASEPSPRVEPWAPSMASLYFMPALFAAVAFLSAMYGFSQISSRLVEDRAAYGDYLHDEVENNSKERRDIAEYLSKLIAQHDSALAEAQKTLFDDQMTLLKNASAAADARDNAVVDLVKARLIPTPPEVTPPVESKSPPESKVPTPCALDTTQIRSVQAALAERFLYGGQPDGIWGPNSENAAMRFQSRMNLPVTGKIDPITASQLGIICKSP